MGENYYTLLGVSEDASTSEIESAYREKLKETHPDVSDRDDASERTKRLIDAKEALTDDDERRKYDSLGHENYLDAESSVQSSAGAESSDATAKEPTSTTTSSRSTETTQSTTSASGTAGTSTATGGRSSRRQRSRGSHVREDSSNTTANSSGTTDSGGDGSWHAWNTQRRYEVERGEDTQRFGGALSSQRAFVLLGSTFVVYPVLLFGALGGVFPLPVNLTVAVCVVLLIAFLQSIPEVGIIVFGIWTLLLPILMFVLLGYDPVSIRSLIAIIAVVFPLGLSVLTRVAIRPISAS